MARFRRGAGLVGMLGALLLMAGCTSAAPSEPTPGGTAPDASGSSRAGSPSPSAGASTVTPPSPVSIEVPAELFGTHVGQLATGTQPLPPRAGAIRLWDAGVAWRQIERVRGEVNWAALDTAVAEAERTGAADILWVHGSPPRWAAKDPDAAGLYGPGTSSAPDEQAYLSILRRIAERYRGRITSYQAWNEANISIFYRGRPAYLAELTLKAQQVLAEADPDALLVGASTTVRSAGPVKPWYGRYADALAERGWPVDAMAVHLYPLADQGAETRAEYARLMRGWLTERGWTGPVWDTEVNFGDRRDFATEIVVVPQKRAAEWVARTYIDSLALGIDRVYWYAWNDHILGIDQLDPQTNEILLAGQAYLTVQEWLVGTTWRGCSGELVAPTGDRAALTTCELTTAKGRAGRILFTHGSAARVAMPEDAARVCRLDGACARAEGATLRVGAPVLVLLDS